MRTRGTDEAGGDAVDPDRREFERFQPDAGAAADHDDGLAGQFPFAPGGKDIGCGGHGDPAVTGCWAAVI